ncbi:MAG TPA: hypothetical protein VK281_19395 [Xanthobacteraceae bacterium]|nr:hypothetical protein [Xanthobacteraceae bacterium]
MRKLALLALLALIGANIVVWPRGAGTSPAPTRVGSATPWDRHPDANIRHFPVKTIADLF